MNAEGKKLPNVVVDSSDSVVENAFGLSIGDVSDEVSRMEISEEEARRIIEVVKGIEGDSVNLNTNLSGTLRRKRQFKIYILKGGESGRGKQGPVRESYNYEFRVHDGESRLGRETRVYLTIKCEKKGSGESWSLGVKANPTSLVNGHNAYSVVLEKHKGILSLTRMMQVPFLMLERILRTANNEFRFSSETKKCIADLRFYFPKTEFAFYIDGTERSTVFNILSHIYNLDILEASSNDKTVGIVNLANMLECEMTTFKGNKSVGNRQEINGLRLKSLNRDTAFGTNVVTSFYKKDVQLHERKGMKTNDPVIDSVKELIRIDVKLYKYTMLRLLNEANRLTGQDRIKMDPSRKIYAWELRDAVRVLQEKREGGFVTWLRFIALEEFFGMSFFCQPLQECLNQLFSTLQLCGSNVEKTIRVGMQSKPSVSLKEVIREQIPQKNLRSSIHKTLEKNSIPLCITLDSLRLYEFSSLLPVLTPREREAYLDAAKSGDTNLRGTMLEKASLRFAERLTETRNVIRNAVDSSNRTKQVTR